MRTLILPTLALAFVVAGPLAAQQARVTISGGDVSRSSVRGDVSRLAMQIPGIDTVLRTRVRVGGDSAQHIALDDFGWKGRVGSVEIDQEDARVIWDVKIVPDTSQQTIFRYRVDAATGGILSIKEFTGVRGLARRKP